MMLSFHSTTTTAIALCLVLLFSQGSDARKKKKYRSRSQPPPVHVESPNEVDNSENEANDAEDVEGPLMLDLTGYLNIGNLGRMKVSMKVDGHFSPDDLQPTDSVPEASTVVVTKRSPKYEPELQDLVDRMRSADVDRPIKYTVNWGNRISGKSDQSPDPLYTEMDETIFTRPVYRTIIDAYKNNAFSPNTCNPENRSKQDGYSKAIFNALTDTDVFKLVFDFLKHRGRASNWETFKKDIWKIWFGEYSRCKGIVGSSGFEHVFFGEIKGDSVSGHHNWLTFYLDEKNDRINYNGYDKHHASVIGSLQYTWNGRLKKYSGFIMDTSPAFDFALFTVCFVQYPGNTKCRFKLDGYPIAVTTFDIRCENGKQKCIGTAYPVILK